LAILQEHSDISALAEVAAHWLVELEEPGADTLRQFATWLQTSPRHVEEFLLVAAVWKEFDRFDTARRVDIQRLVAEAQRNLQVVSHPSSSAGNSFSPAGNSASPARNSSRLPRFATAVAAALAVVALAVGLTSSVGPREYATAKGEQRALKLEDGSVIYLNTQSRVEVHYSARVRAIDLREGEAMFNVEHDPSRPFRVTAGATVIQAVGTRFNVYRSNVGATVSVVEGVVQISPDVPLTARVNPPAQGEVNTLQEPHRARVSAGEQAQIARDGAIVTHTVPELARLVAWRERRLVFRGDPLEEVATQFNRYNAVQIHIEAGALRDRRITGVFDADDPRSFIQFLSRDVTLAVEEDRDEVIVRPGRVN
jgi:transmembrane sensor